MALGLFSPRDSKTFKLLSGKLVYALTPYLVYALTPYLNLWFCFFKKQYSYCHRLALIKTLLSYQSQNHPGLFFSGKNHT